MFISSQEEESNMNQIKDVLFMALEANCFVPQTASACIFQNGCKTTRLAAVPYPGDYEDLADSGGTSRGSRPKMFMKLPYGIACYKCNGAHHMVIMSE